MCGFKFSKKISQLENINLSLHSDNLAMVVFFLTVPKYPTKPKQELVAAKTKWPSFKNKN
jgi:hypothetical protein